jgi:hypothetical protein
MGEPSLEAIVVSTNQLNDLALLKVDIRPNARGRVQERVIGPPRRRGGIVAKADALSIAEASGGDLVQNVNFAIRGSLAQSFLDTNNVDYDIGDRAQDFTVLILSFE